MKQSYLYTVVFFAISFPFVTPVMLLLRNYYKQFLTILATLSGNDLLKVKLLNDKLGFYTPPYIVKDKTIIFFQILLGQTILRLAEITSIDIKKMQTKYGFKNLFTIATPTKKFKGLMDGDEFLKKNLIDEILNQNPQVKINGD